MIEPSPEFRTWIYTRTTFDTEDRARALVNYLLASPRFAPDHFGAYEPLRRLTPDRVEQTISLIVSRAKQERDPGRVLSITLFERSRHPRCNHDVSWARLPHRAFEISGYRVEDDFVRHAENLADWLDFVFGLLHLHEAWYALFALGVETHEKNLLTWRKQHPRAVDPAKGIVKESGAGLELTESIPGVYWGNYFGPFYVEWFGRERLDTLPCVEKRWLDTGGIFFTTAPTPFDWDTPEARQLQQTVKEHLGADAFFDIETVRQVLAELEPIPEYIKPEQLQPPRRVPDFPFKIESPQRRSVEEEMEDARRYFEGQGFTFESVEESTMIFQDDKGGIVQITFGPAGKVEYWPKL